MKLTGTNFLSGMKKKRESTKENIRLSTFRLLSERGYANISMRDIAAEAGVALSQIAYYYHTKEGLISEVADEAVERFVDGFDAALRAGREDPVAAARSYFSDTSGKDAALWRVVLDFVGQASWVPAFRESINSFFSRLSAILEEKLKMSGADAAIADASDIIGALFGASVMRMLAAGV